MAWHSRRVARGFAVDLWRPFRTRRLLLVFCCLLEFAIVSLATHFLPGVFRGSLGVLSITAPMLMAVWWDPMIGVIAAGVGAFSFIPYLPSVHDNRNIAFVFLTWVLSTFLVSVAARASGATQTELLNRLLWAEGEERGRIASDLHDDTIQVMTAAILTLDMVDAEVKRQPSYQRARGLMTEAVNRLRTLSFQLRPPSLEAGGLNVALADLCHEFERQFADLGATLTCDVSIPHRQSRFAEELVHRVALELLQNAWKHSHATRVSLVARERKGGVEMVLRDNGVGFNVERIGAAGHHFGLPAKIERVEWAGGTLVFQSGKDGTTATLLLPDEGHP